MILVLITNLLVGLGLLLLGSAMLRRPERVWVGVRVTNNAEQAARVRRANFRTAPWLLILGAAEILTALAVLLADLSPLLAAVGGLVILLLAIAVIAIAAVLSR